MVAYIQPLSRDEVRARLHRACNLAGGVKPWASAHQCSWQNVYAVLRGAAEPGPKILAALWLRRVEHVYAPASVEEPSRAPCL